METTRKMENVGNFRMASTRSYGIGIIGGLAGGIVFGFMMSMMGMMPTIANMVGSDSVAVGWTIHFVISATIGFFYAWWFGRMANSWMKSIGLGIVHGIIWWIVGALTIMPLVLDMGIQYTNALERMNLMSLMGHVIYGMIVGIVFYGMTKPNTMKF